MCAKKWIFQRENYREKGEIILVAIVNKFNDEVARGLSPVVHYNYMSSSFDKLLTWSKFICLNTPLNA